MSRIIKVLRQAFSEFTICFEQNKKQFCGYSQESRFWYQIFLRGTFWYDMRQYLILIIRYQNCGVVSNHHYESDHQGASLSILRIHNMFWTKEKKQFCGYSQESSLCYQIFLRSTFWYDMRRYLILIIRYQNCRIVSNHHYESDHQGASPSIFDALVVPPDT